MRFLYGDRIREEIKNLVDRSGKLSVAVAYWGKGGAGHTGLTGRGDRENTRVICDPRSGACNPAELRVLLALPVQLWELPGLHAKVWISDATVIVGSANASIGGLGDEEGHQANFEAAVMTNDEAFARDVQGWFDCLWGQKALPLGNGALEAADRAWARRHPPSGRAGDGSESVTPHSTDLQALRQRLIDQVVETAEGYDRSGSFSEDITDRAVGFCAGDPAWHRDYDTYLDGGPDQHKQKERINTQFARRIGEALGAQGRPPAKPSTQSGGILTEYTPLFRR